MAYVLVGAFKLLALQAATDASTTPGQTAPADYDRLANQFLTDGGVLPPWLLPACRSLLNLARLRWRRIWALARLSFKEAVRRRVLWVFSALLLVFLFASWFIASTSRKTRSATMFDVIYWAMTPLLLVTAGLLAAFSIPADIRNQTIHTIVTKPVERFEIVLGRFLGYMLLMTVVLFVMTAVGLLYVSASIDPEARVESLQARVPVYGDLTFVGDRRQRGLRMGVPRATFPDGAEQHVPGRLGLPRSSRANWRPERSACPASSPSTSSARPREKRTRASSARSRSRAGSGIPPTPASSLRSANASAANRTPTPMPSMKCLPRSTATTSSRSKEVVDYHTLSLDVPIGVFKNAAGRCRPASGGPQLEAGRKDRGRACIREMR